MTATSKAALETWRQRERVGCERACAALLAAWDWHHNDLWEAFGSVDALASALREVAPPLTLDRPLKVWRGGIIPRDVHPAQVAAGLSWTTSLDVACWFAVGAPRLRFPADRPVVFALEATADEIIALHHGHTATTETEREALLDPAKLDLLTHRITVEGTAFAVADLRNDSRIPEEVITRWREAADRYSAVRYDRTKLTQTLSLSTSCLSDSKGA